MANAELNPRDWRDIRVLRADRGLRAYAAMTGELLHAVARRVVDRELTVPRELCVPAAATPRPEQPPRRPRGTGARRGRRAGVDREAARADL